MVWPDGSIKLRRFALRRRPTTAPSDPPRMSALGGALNRWTQHFILEEKMEWIAMKQGPRRGFGAAEKTELWDRWQRGETLKAIGRTFGKPSSSIYFQLAPHGGIRPAPHRRS